MAFVNRCHDLLWKPPKGTTFQTRTCRFQRTRRLRPLNSNARSLAETATSFRLVHGNGANASGKSPVYSPKTTIINNTDSEKNQAISSLKKKSEQWLQLPQGSWSTQDVAVVRALMEDWLRLPPSHRERAPWSTKILNRWIQQCASQSNKNKGNAAVFSIHNNRLLDMLHRVLFAWRRAVQESRFSDSFVFEEANSLVNNLEALSQQTKDIRLRPGDKAYTMLLQILALLHRQVPNEGGNAIELLELCMKRRRQTSDNRVPADLVIVWNACIHVLAKSSRHQSDAPKQAEKLLECMITGSPLSLSGSVLGIRPPRPDVVSFSTVLNAWANSPQPGAAKRAHVILERMVELSKKNKELPAPNRSCFNTVIAAYAKSQEQGSAQHAQDILDRMQQSNDREIQPDYVSFLSAMTAWARSSHDRNGAEKAEALLERIQLLYNETGNTRIRPTVSCYAVVLDAWSRRLDSGPKVESLLHKMEEEVQWKSKHTKERPSWHSIPFKTACTAAIRAWGNTTSDVHSPERAERLLQYLHERSSSLGLGKEIKPSTPYAETIAAWLKSAREDAPRRALGILRIMEEHDVEPDTFLFNNLLNVYAQRGDAESALSTLDKMHESHLRGNMNAKVDAVSYNTVINALARSRDFPESAQLATKLLGDLLALYSEHKEESMRPKEITYASVILAWSNSGKVDCGERAEEILWGMLDLPERFGDDTPVAKPDTAICNCVLRAWSRSSDGAATGRAEDLLEWMHDEAESGKNLQVRPDRLACNYVLKIWAKSRRASSIRQIEEHLDRMIRNANSDEEHPLFPNTFSYNCLLEAIKNSKRRDRAARSLNILEQLLNSSSNSAHSLWDLQSFHLVFMACMPVTGDDSNTTNAVVRTFEKLKAINDPSVRISTRTVELILRSYLSTGGVDESFFREVFQFGYRMIGPFDGSGVVASLQSIVSEHIIECLLRVKREVHDDPGLSGARSS